MESNSYEYVGVYLLDCPYFLDGIFDYYIPLEMRGDVFPGRFLTVPFGKSNRKHMAVARELRHCPEYSDVKPVSEVCYDRPELSREMLDSVGGTLYRGKSLDEATSIIESRLVKMSEKEKALERDKKKKKAEKKQAEQRKSREKLLRGLNNKGKI